MNRTVIRAIAAKDIRAITSNSQVWLAMVLIPLVFCGIMPLALVLTAKYAKFSGSTADSVSKLLDKLPVGALHDKLAAMPDLNHQFAYFAVNYTMLPLFLLLPLITSSVVSANSFVGEKERHTLESLLFAPIGIKDLFVAKIAASFIPAYTISLGGFVLFGIIVDSITYPMFNGLLFPSINWIISILWLVPALTLFSIFINVLISARVKGYQEAQQMSGLLALPVIALIVSQMTGLFLLSPLLLVALGAVLLGLCAALLPVMAKMNSRNVLFEKQIH